MPTYRVIYETESTEDGSQRSMDIDTDLPLYSEQLKTWYPDRVTEVLRTVGRTGGHEKVALVRIMEAQETDKDEPTN